MDGQIHLVPEQRTFECVGCDRRLTQNTRPYSCPHCGKTMLN